VGLTRGANKYHVIRATLEALAYQSNDVLCAMTEDSGIRLASLKIDGGACANNFLMQFQADISDVPVHRPVTIETTSLGAAYLAGLAVGYWKNKEDVLENWQISRSFEPEMTKAIRENLLIGWHKAVKTSLGWEK
jgi:glycerol kinase